jgi:DNA-directed RNA polymerase specialized sigma24 family protein
MDERDWLAERFEEHRGHLRAVAYRMLGSVSEADDAVQEAWLRLSRTDASDGGGGARGLLIPTVEAAVIRTACIRHRKEDQQPDVVVTTLRTTTLKHEPKPEVNEA